MSAQVPAGAVAANPNVVYYAGGTCEFYDAAGAKLLEVDAAEAVWSCSPAKTSWAVVTPRSGGYYEFPNYTNTLPRVDHREMLQPFWSGDTIYRETVVLSGPNTTSQLLYPPRKILSVTNYNGSVAYEQGTDYTIAGRSITQRSARPSATYVAKPGVRGNGTPNGLINIAATSWTYVTYIPDRSDWNPTDVWNNKSIADLPRTRMLLRQRRPITVQALGMSLTAGLNVSGFAGDPKNFPPTDPYMRGYVDMFCDELRMRYGSDVTLYNSSCGGKTIAWAEKYCEALVNPNQPDLVLIDMGMNDIWGTTTGSAFRTSLSATIQKIKAGCPHAEFIVIGNMLPDISAPGAPADGETWMYEFLQQMKSVASPGVALFDMTTMSDTLYARKGSACFTSNSLHPNDYMARWYAQGLSALVDHVVTNVMIEQAERPDALQLTVYPQPAGADVTLSVEATQSDVPLQASIRSSSGALIVTMPLQHGCNTFTQEQLGLANGWYLITVTAGNELAHQALLIAKP